LSDIKPAKARSERTDSASETEPNKPVSAIEEPEAASVQGEAGPGSGSAPAIDGEAGTRDLAIATQGGPLVAEIELEPLTLRPQLPPSSEENASVETAVGFWGRYRLFTITVVLPMLIGSLYLFALAAPRFASSASFIVRSAAQSGLPNAVTSVTQQSGSGTQQGTPPMQLSASALLPQGQGASTIAQDETYAINAYLTSRDVVDQLSKNNDLRGILGRPEGDFIFRYPTLWLPNDSEFLYQRFEWMVRAYVEPDTMISTIEVNAFRPEDAQGLATAMLEYAEALVNQMNHRSYDDGLATANRFVAEAQQEVDAVEAELKAYRNASASIDPNAVAQSKLKVIEGLLTQLGQIQAKIAQQAAITPTSPILAALRAQAESYRAEIEKRQLEIAGSSGSEADKLATYEELTTRAELAARALAAAVAGRDQARNSVERQHLFIQVIARPNLSPDYARYPRRTLDLAVLLAISLTLFLILRKVGGAAGAHGG
jgi:capsular polysaccharide transport system permease protein